MSLPELIKDELQAFKPFLKYKLGTIVFLVSDLNKDYPMTIIGFSTEDDNCIDYYTSWLSSKGEICTECFPEECLNLKTD